MTKEELTELQDKILKLERIMMRDVDEKEIEYLKTNSVEDFLKEVLGFDNEDLVVLMLLQKSISDWCTRPATYNEFEDDDSILNWKDGINFFDFLNEEELKNLNVFKEDPPLRRVADVLQTIVDNLQEELKKYKNKEVKPAPKFRELTKDEIQEMKKEAEKVINEKPKYKAVTPEGAKNINDGFNFEVDYFDSLKPELLSGIKKAWLKYVDRCDSTRAFQMTCDEYMQDYPEDKSPAYMLEFPDEFISNYTDHLKDAAIKNIVWSLCEGETIEFEDEDIQMEVLDYLYNNKYKVKSINNKVSIL